MCLIWINLVRTSKTTIIVHLASHLFGQDVSYNYDRTSLTDEEKGSFGATRYPCMPSLVAMQQMRNRLNLAFLGKKLMKWSAMATGRELRKISSEMHGVYGDYHQDSCNGYILLARARYFLPHLNSIVLENVSRHAQVSLSSSTRTISGVRVVQYHIEDTGKDPYEHLGIERGGQVIKEAKRVWNELIKRMIMILELRTSFILVEQANKSATKKMNVLGKIVIPKTILSIEYIASELEEHEREEFFRLKKILEIKVKQNAARQKHLKPKKAPEEPEPAPLGSSAPEPKPLSLPIEPLPTVIETPEEPPIPEKKCPVCKEPISGVTPAAELVGDRDLEAYKSQLSQLADKTKEVEAKVTIEGLSSFLKNVEEIKKTVDRISKIAHAKHVTVIPPDVNVDDLCPKCKALYDEQKNVKPVEPPPPPLVEPVVEPPVKAVMEQPPEPVRQVSEISRGPGTYEVETKVITRIVRKKNPDGSITEEKRVLKVRKEVTDPSIQPTDADDTGDKRNDSARGGSASSSKSNQYAGSKTIGLILVNNRSRRLRKSQSEVLSPTSPIGFPVVRYCMSLGNINSTFNEETTTRSEVSEGVDRFINSALSIDINRKLTSSWSDSVLNSGSKKEVIRRSQSCSCDWENSETP